MKKLLSLILALLLLLGTAGTALAAPRPYGDNPRGSVDYYIDVNESYQNKKGTITGALYGYGFLHANVSSYDVEYGDKVGKYNNRAYNVKLASSTARNASFDLVFDVGCSSSGNTVPVINNSPGLSGMSKLDN